ncbi:hypothetical protein PF005_g18982 [Phytophthora fragariae]|uniref:SWIM-type domain-containing protein n=1 Tax=Phytophthora fragariae TaxID=53985 RepID=A0A6A3ECL1_9STRA|nr:hypothetical protein PF003_g26157 [Phytophthora fragariae]KAE8930067.1 hypothetical protein PF009_g19832 [Phytophthora fragariae]KAE8997294.1 hypothetical protein PF011_g15541 [Phytophthora fragariae]KAE9091190.1 hypothetical protein PF010_g18281 [Phytophthora fragariae]KAE9109033.1 hypothetical protein PF007_g12406 [Phytophthora fragariae]
MSSCPYQAGFACCHVVVNAYCFLFGPSREEVPISAQMGANYARMETDGQPGGGWHVDLSKFTCGWKYHFKFAICIHVIFDPFQENNARPVRTVPGFLEASPF